MTPDTLLLLAAAIALGGGGYLIGFNHGVRWTLRKVAELS